MKSYELVCVIDSALSAAEIKDKKKAIESIITSQNGSTIVDTDDMGLVPLAYPLNGQPQAAIVSYHISAESESLDEMKTQLSLEKGVEKFYFYAMREGEAFLKYADLQKKYEEMHQQDEKLVESEDDANSDSQDENVSEEDK